MATYEAKAYVRLEVLVPFRRYYVELPSDTTVDKSVNHAQWAASGDQFVCDQLAYAEQLVRLGLVKVVPHEQA